MNTSSTSDIEMEVAVVAQSTNQTDIVQTGGRLAIEESEDRNEALERQRTER